MPGARLGGIYVDIRAGVMQFGKDLDKAKLQATTATQKMQAKFDSINWRRAGLAAVAFGGVVAVAMKKAVDAASDLEEATNKFTTVFHKTKVSAAEFEKVLVKSYTMSTRAARTHLSAVGDLLKPMGLTEKAALDMAFASAKLAADIGSFNDQPTAAVLNNIKSALVGEYEPMRKFGVALSAARVATEALNMGLADTKENLTAGHKAQAAFKLIMEGSKDAIGDVARSSESYALQVKQLQANWEDFLAKVGQPLMENLAGILKNFNGWVAVNKELIDQKVQETIDSIRVSVETLYNLATGVSGQIAEVGVIGFLLFGKFSPLRLVGVLYLVNDTLKAIGADVGSFMDSANQAGEAIGKMWDILTGKERETDPVVYVGKITGQMDALGVAAETAGTAIADAMKEPIEYVGDLSAANEEWAGIIAEIEGNYKAVSAAQKEHFEKNQEYIKNQQSATEKLYNSLKFKAAGYYAWQAAQIQADYQANLQAGVDKELAETARIERMKQLEEDLYTWKKTRADQWKTEWDGINAELEAGHATMTTNLQTAWELYEQARLVASDATNIWLGSSYGNAVKAIYDAIKVILPQIIALWTGKAVGESAKGMTWQQKAAAMLKMAGKAVIAYGAAKKAWTKAESGGWLASHQQGGIINQGSGHADDVYLGHRAGSQIMGMGGEYVINKKSTNKYLDLLDAINRDEVYKPCGNKVGYATGGPLDDDPNMWKETADSFNITAAETFIEYFLKSKGNWKKALAKAAIALGTTVGMSFLVKKAATTTKLGDWLVPSLPKLKWDDLDFAEGGQVPEGNQPAGFKFKFPPWIIPPFKGKPCLPGFPGWPGCLVPKLPNKNCLLLQTPKGMWDAIVDSTRQPLKKATQSLLTPGDFKPLEGDMNWWKGWLKEQHAYVTKLFADCGLGPGGLPITPGFPGMASGGYLGSYRAGGVLPADGFYLGHQGETIVPKEATPALIGGGASGPINITVQIGDDEFGAYIAKVSDSVRVKAEKLGVGERPLY